MSYRLHTLLFHVLILLVIVVSCVDDNDNTMIIGLDTPKGSDEVQIGDLFNGPRLIKLETADSLFLPSNFQYWLGEDHLIVFTRSQILQFSADGRFIRLLKQRGRGPDEFSRVCCYDVDESNDVLYYLDLKAKGKLILLDLLDGTEMEYITLPESIDLDYSGIKILPDGRILCFNSFYEESLNLCYYLEEGGEPQEIIKKPNWMRENPPTAYWSYIGSYDNKISYMNGITDTLFRLENSGLSSEFFIELEVRYHPNDRPSGFFPAIAFESNRYLLIKRMEVVSVYDKGLGRISRRLLDEYGLFLYDKKDQLLKEVDGLYINSLEIPDFTSMTQSGLNVSMLLEANDLISWRKKVLSDDQLRNDLPEPLLDIILKVEVNDNPYILAGKI
ncbi:MAG: 6-bladed beta-propeller [Bacteroidales bacterium]|nr:6-bladed beta-propeller [Bacteroidales bacterium]